MINKNIIFKVLAVLYFGVLTYCCITLNRTMSKVEIVDKLSTPETNFVVITAAHIQEDDMRDMTKVYVDEEKDVAVYINNDYKPELPSIGDEVTFYDGSKGEVRELTEDGFYVKQNVNTVTKGFSGTSVLLSNGKYVGFVSSMRNDGFIYCLAY